MGIRVDCSTAVVGKQRSRVTRGPPTGRWRCRHRRRDVKVSGSKLMLEEGESEFDEGQTVTTAWLGYSTSRSGTLLGFFLVCSGQNLSGVVQGGYSGDPTPGRGPPSHMVPSNRRAALAKTAGSIVYLGNRCEAWSPRKPLVLPSVLVWLGCLHKHGYKVHPFIWYLAEFDRITSSKGLRATKLASVHLSIIRMLLDKHSHDGMPDQCA